MKQHLISSLSILLILVILVTGCTKGDPLGLLGVRPPKEAPTTPEETPEPAPTVTEPEPAPQPVLPEAPPPKPKPPPPLPVAEVKNIEGFVDFSGLWRSRSSGPPRSECKSAFPFSGTRRCDGNVASSLDWMQLRVVSTEVSPGTIQINYEGEYHHGHSFMTRGDEQYVWKTNAHIEEYVYKLTGSATYDLKGGFIEFQVGGELTTEPWFDHIRNIGISGEGEGFGISRSTDPAYSGITKKQPAQVPEDGVYKFSFGYSEMAEGIKGSSPPDTFSSEDSMHFINDMPLPIFNRYFIHEARPLQVNGTITGEVTNASFAVIKRGTVYLFEEGNDETPIKQTSIVDGLFSFAGVPVFAEDSTGTKKGLRRARYTVEVVHAETDVDAKVFDGQPVVYFKLETVHNVPSGDRLNLRLGLLSEPAMKKLLVEQLSEIGKTNYADLESQAGQYVDDLIEEGLDDIALEKLRRGIWAERIVKEGAESADAALGLILKSTGNLFAEMWGDLFKGESDRVSESKRFQEQRNKFRETRHKATVFGVDPVKIQKYERDLDQKSRRADISDAANAWNLAIKIMKNRLFLTLKNSGMKAETAEEVAYWFATGVRSLLIYIKTDVAMGAAKLPIKQAIPWLVDQTRPVIFDNRVEIDVPIAGRKIEWDPDFIKSFPSYTSSTRAFLEIAVNKMKSWDKHDAEQYRQDSMLAKGYYDSLVGEYTDIEQLHHYITALQDTADLSADVFDAIGTIGHKYFEAAEKIMTTAKYAFNAGAIIVPAIFFFWEAPKLTAQGVFQSYGEELPEGVFETAMELDDDSDTSVEVVSNIDSYFVSLEEEPISVTDDDGSTISENLKGIIDRLFDAFGTNTAVLAADDNSQGQNSESGVSMAAENYKEVLDRLTELLRTNEIGQAIELVVGDSPESYEGALTEFDYTVQVLLNQVANISLSSYDGMVADYLPQSANMHAEFKALETELAGRMWEFYSKVMIEEYEDLTDPYYIAERNKIVAVAQSLQLKVDGMTELLQTLSEVLLQKTVTPMVMVRLSFPQSTETGESTINASPEEFTVRAHVSNTSSVPISNLTARLTLVSPLGTMTAVTSPEQEVGSGTLAPNDGSRGTGDDEADVEWTASYRGNLTEENILLMVNILEEGGVPSSFVTFEAQQPLMVDPLKTDKDLDGMLDDYEAANGLDVSRDDTTEDPDNDGLQNRVEFRLDTNPRRADTDGDGLSDGEENTGGEDGFITNPLSTDSDGDGVPDRTDGAPNDPTTAEAEERPGEPVVAVDKKVVTLTPEAPITAVIVSNSGEGTLYWTATAENDALAITVPSLPKTREDGILIISVPPGFIFEAESIAETVVYVVDAFGMTTDVEEITVRVGPAP
jgi:hypothetical protein